MTDTTAQIDAAFAPAPGKSIKIILAEPITNPKGPAISELTLAKPNAGNLRGLKLPDIVTGDVDTILALLPRISTPPVARHEVDALSSEDIGEITGAVISFFMSQTDKARLELMRAG